MHAGGRIAAVLLLILLLVPTARAEFRAYGGRGEDMLLAMTEADGGLFAVGTTASSDGDLSARTRTGDAGWALLLDEDGERRWSYASAHTGLARMIEPAALTDGRYSLVLTDEEAQRAEWLLLDEAGKAVSRTAVSPERIEDGAGYTVSQYLLTAQQPPELAMILRSGQDMRAVTLAESGAVLRDEAFRVEGKGLAAADGFGALAWVGAAQGRLNVLWMEDEKACRLALEGAQVTSIADALMQADGSVICCGEADAGGAAKGFLARVSREGELLFGHTLELAQRHICQTETGFAAYGSDGETAEVVFVDEDGGVLDAVTDVPADALDMASTTVGAALLTHAQGRRQPQAVITAVVPEIRREEQETEQEETQDTPAANTAASLPVTQGYLVCGESDGFGVQVTCMDGSGEARWSTRIPIHTAADALQWLCAAQTEDGGILLGGRYLTGSGESAVQEGVIALLSGDGVLRRIETIDGAGAVCAMEIAPDGGVTLHAATGAAPALEPDAEIVYGL